MYLNFFSWALPILYLVTDPRDFTHQEFLDHIEKAIRGGVDVVQFRDKKMSDEKFLATAQALKKITDRYGVPLVINDRVNIAQQILASGVHVGQSDTLGTYTSCMGIVGFSIDLEEQVASIPVGVDYLGVGPIFPTKTKLDAAPCIGLDGLRKIRVKTKLPIIAIGGIKEENIPEVIKSGADGVAVIGELMDAKNPEEYARYLKKILVEAYTCRMSKL